MQGGKFRGRSGPSQCASAILMVRPKHFGFNAQTAGTNRFQQAGAQDRVSRTKSRSGHCANSTLSPRRWPQRASVSAWRGLRRPAQTRRRFPEQLGEFPRRRHRGAVSDARREPPHRAAHGSHRRGGARNRFQGAPHRSISPHHEKVGAIPRRHGQPGAGPSRHAWPMPAVRRAPTRRWRANGRARWAIELECSPPPMSPARPSTTPTSLMSVGTRIAVVALDSDRAGRPRAASASAWRFGARSARHRSRRDARLRRQHAGGRQLGRVPGRLPHPGDVATPRGTRSPRRKYARLYAVGGCGARRCPIDIIERHGGGSVRCMLAEIFLP